MAAPSPLTVLTRCVRALDGDDRDGQHTLTEAVAAAFDEPHHLVVEAPTGSGKSLAYLAAVVASDRVAVIATATLALQDQLWRKDVPLVHEHGGVPFDAAVLKGRSQYLCLARLHAAAGGEALFDERPGPDFAAQLGRLERYAAESETGDAAGLDGVPPSVWRAVSCGPQECPGTARCPDGDACFAERARVQADGVRVLIVNHALYLAHLAAGGGVLPHHDVVIFDEGHAVVDVATRALGSEVTPGGLRQLAARVRVAGVTGRDADALFADADRLEDSLGEMDGRVDPTDGRIAEVLAGAAERVAALGAALRRDNTEPRVAQTARLVAARLEALRHLQAPAVGEVAWVEGAERPVLRLAPVDVGPRLAERLFAAQPCVVTSATLGPGARFEPLARRLGLDPDAAGSAASSYAALRLGSPFDVRGQALLYVPRTLPDPRQPGWADAAVEELDRARRRRRGSGARAVHLAAVRRAVRRGAAGADGAPGPRAGRRGQRRAARAVRRRGDLVPGRDPRLLAGRRRAGTGMRAGGHRPAAVRSTRRSARAGPTRGGRGDGRQRVRRRRPARGGTDARAGRRPAAAPRVRPWGGRRARLAAGDGRLPAGAPRRAAADAPHRHPRRRGGDARGSGRGARLR